MENTTTFEFKRVKDFLTVWEALNDTSAKFASYAYRCITVFSEHWANEVRESCETAGIKFEEV